jgi:hypothetical protein
LTRVFPASHCPLLFVPCQVVRRCRPCGGFPRLVSARSRLGLCLLAFRGQVRRCVSHVTRHTSHVTRHTSHVTRHTSHVTRHTSHVIFTQAPLVLVSCVAPPLGPGLHPTLQTRALPPPPRPLKHIALFARVTAQRSASVCRPRARLSSSGRLVVIRTWVAQAVSMRTAV